MSKDNNLLLFISLIISALTIEGLYNYFNIVQVEQKLIFATALIFAFIYLNEKARKWL
jgi:phosphoglycerol transferase MdoB-like AlkP superfamily enzyme